MTGGGALVAADINQEPLLLLKNFILWPSLCVFRHYWSIICTLGSVICNKLIYSLEDASKGIDTSKVWGTTYFFLVSWLILVEFPQALYENSAIEVMNT